MSDNKADIYRPVVATHVGPAPMILKTIIKENNHSMVGGVPQAALKLEHYVLVSALPQDLQERIKTAIQTLIAAM